VIWLEWISNCCAKSASVFSPLIAARATFALKADEEGLYIDVIKHAAVATLAQIDPYAAAGAMAQGDEVEQQKALILVKSALNKSRAEERPPWQYRWLPFESDLPRGELTEANVLFQLGKFSDAREHFEAASKEFQLRDRHGSRWFAADDGLATTFIKENRLEEAKDAIKRSLEENPQYDSALYHSAEIDDNMSRRFFLEQTLSSFCEAEKSFAEAREKYTRLLEDHPTFAIGYTQEGTMMLIRLNWLRSHSIQNCDEPNAKPVEPSVVVQKWISETKQVLTVATIVDSKNPESWYELANLQFQLQNKNINYSITTQAERIKSLSEAIKDYNIAISLNPDDFNMWFRLGVALSSVATLNQKSSKSLLNLASNAFCKALDLNKPHQTMIYTIKNELAKLSRFTRPCVETELEDEINALVKKQKVAAAK
jgi:tetratricopeptide (TPR) repeat protein